MEKQGGTMKHLEEMRQAIQNRILRNCSSRAYGLAVMKQIDAFAEASAKAAVRENLGRRINAL